MHSTTSEVSGFNPEGKPFGRNCNLCSHQCVCSAFALFKTTIEPNIMIAGTLKAENLAWICSHYEEKIQEVNKK